MPALVVLLAYGTVLHVVQLLAGGADPYPHLPGWLGGHFVSLTLLDPLAAGLVVRSRMNAAVTTERCTSTRPQPGPPAQEPHPPAPLT